MGRKRVKTPELRKEIVNRGVDAVNSDEEGNEYLDEAQQELFVTQMTTIVDEYISRWRSMFAWVSVLVMYVHGGCLLGLIPWTRPFASIMSSSESFLGRLIFAPFSIGSTFYRFGWTSAAIGILSLISDYIIIRACMRSSLETNREQYLRKFRMTYLTLSTIVFTGWLILALAANIQPLWGKHAVVMIITFLLGFAGDTFVSSKILAIAGLEKLNQFKYSYKKL